MDSHHLGTCTRDVGASAPALESIPESPSTRDHSGKALSDHSDSDKPLSSSSFQHPCTLDVARQAAETVAPAGGVEGAGGRSGGEVSEGASEVCDLILEIQGEESAGVAGMM